MRAVGSSILRRLSPHISTNGLMVFGLGVACGVTAVAILSQIVAALGVSYGVRLGLGIGTILGVTVGARGLRNPRPISAAGQLLSLTAAVVLWPTWTAVQLDLAQSLPESFWNWSLGAECCGVLFGVLSWGVPIAAGTQLLMVAAAWRRDEKDHSEPRLSVAVGLACGIGLMACVLAPAWGILWPTLGTLAFVSLGLCVMEWSGSRVAWRRSIVTNMPAPDWLSAIAAVLAGFQLHAACGLLSEIAPATLPLWQSTMALLIAGWCAGRWLGKPAVTRIATLSPSTMLLALMSTGLLLLLMSAVMIDLNLWMSSRIVTPIALEACRLLLAAVVLGPTAVWCGMASQGLNNAVARSGGSVPTVLSGMLLGEISLAVSADPLVRLWMVVGIVALVCVAELIQRRVPWRSRKSLTTAGLCATLVLGTILAPTTWPVGRAVQLLYSTPSLLAARSDWPTELLPHLDDVHLVANAGGTDGRWTLWKTRGAELILRCQGVPRGAITSRPAWSPQYAPEIAATVWPLVLVDQPARVLVLGAGSSASLQAALAFPLKDIVCCEADDALMRLIRGDIAVQGGFDPFADDRCRHVRQPSNWLALATSDKFDVIVSGPPTAISPEAASAMTTDFYRRAAQRLSPQGIFCQRISSVDFGPLPLLTTATSMQAAFTEIACLEVGAGEFLLLGAHDPAVLVREDLPKRLELPHVVHVFSHCNWDWSMPLNLPAYDRAALAEAAAEIDAQPQSVADPWLSFFTPRELMRWAPKLQETATLLSKPRTSPVVYPLPEVGAPPQTLSAKTSRKSRYLEWVGPQAEDPVVLRRLAEAASRMQLVYTYPDAHWWEYRKELRQQLQDHPRTGIQKVNFTASRDPSRWHPEDRQRRAYFEALGVALNSDAPTAEQLNAVEECLEPFDPLLTLFAHQELAELYARGNVNPQLESLHRLHVIYYAPSGDASVRNVVAEIDHLVAHPEAAPSNVDRFEQLNGLLQTLRGRWEARNGRPSKSVRVTQQEIEHSLVSVERALETMGPLAAEAGWTAEEWEHRQAVLERILIRPFRGYRDQLARHAQESERKTRELLQRSTAADASTPAQ